MCGHVSRVVAVGYRCFHNLIHSSMGFLFHFIFFRCLHFAHNNAKHSYRPFLAMNCDGKLGRLLFVCFVGSTTMAGNGNGGKRRKGGRKGAFHDLIFGQYLFRFGVFLVFLWGIKCTRARIHPYTFNCE